jgi:hypothetical protein
MKLAREETRIMVTGRSFYRKNNLKFKGRNRNRGEKKIGNRNLGKMARSRNTAWERINAHIVVSRKPDS